MRRLPWLAAAVLAALPVSLPAQEPAKSPILLYVHVPADARLAVNGVPVSQTGPVRRLISPPLVKGEKGVYTLTLAYTKDGKTVHVEREVTVTGGQDGRVDLTHEQPDDEPTVEPRKADPRAVAGPAKKDPPKVEPKTDTPPKKDTDREEGRQAGRPVHPDPAGDGGQDARGRRGQGRGRRLRPGQRGRADRHHRRPEAQGEARGRHRAGRRAGRLAKENAEKAGVADKVEIRQGDVLKLKDVSEATVVTLQLLPDVNERLRPILRRTLKPGARVVSYDFDMGEDWKPEKEVTVKDKDGRDHVVYLWTIKAAKKADPKDGDIPPIPLKTVPPPMVEPKKDEPQKEEPTAIGCRTSRPRRRSSTAMLKLAGVKEGDTSTTSAAATAGSSSPPSRTSRPRRGSASTSTRSGSRTARARRRRTPSVEDEGDHVQAGRRAEDEAGRLQGRGRGHAVPAPGGQPAS